MKSILGRISIGIVTLALIVVVATGQAMATPYTATTTYGDSVNSGNYNELIQWGSGISGIDATHDWANSDTWLRWDITEQGGGMYKYEYTWNTLTKDLSHIIIELTDGITIAGDNIYLPAGATSEIQSDGYQEDEGNPGLPHELYGIKVNTNAEVTNFSFWFTVDKAPVWGNFYAKDGGGTGEGAVIAYNTGFTNPQALTGIFIARPNGAPSIPDPAAVFLLGSACLIGFSGARRKFKK